MEENNIQNTNVEIQPNINAEVQQNESVENEEKKDKRTNNVVVLTDDPIQVELEGAENFENEVAQDMRKAQENAAEAAANNSAAAPAQTQQDLPTEQSGNITF